MRRLNANIGVLMAGLLLVFAAAPAARADVRQAPASRVALDLPEGYVPSRLFSGFVNERAGVSLVVVELPEPAYEQLAGSLTAEALAAKGITGAEAGKLERPDPYLFMRGVQASAQGPVAKFIIALHGNGVAALVTANVQREALDRGLVAAADIERILASASIAAAAAPARDVFRLGYLGPFKPAGRVLGTARAYTPDGRMDPPAPGSKRPILIVAPSLDQRPVENAAQTAEALLARLPGLQSVEIDERASLRIADMDATELVGHAKDKEAGREVALWQLLIHPKEGGYYRLVGQMPLAERETLLPELRKIAQSFRPVE